jgi:hypothetical protein
MNASIAPILESRWGRLTLMAAVGLALAMALSVASSKSASAQALCFDPNTNTTFVCSEEQAALEAALQVAVLQDVLQNLPAAQTDQGASTIPSGGSFFSTSAVMNPNPFAVPFPSNVQPAPAISGQGVLPLNASFTPATTPALTIRPLQIIRQFP